MSRFIFTYSNLFGMVVALTSKPPSENDLAEVSYVCSLRAIQQNSSHHSSHHSTHQNSNHSSIRHRSNHRSRKRPWCMSAQIPECPSLHPISSFQDRIDPTSMFCLCVRLWHLGSHCWFLWIFLWSYPCFPYSCLCLSKRVLTLGP